MDDVKELIARANAAMEGVTPGPWVWREEKREWFLAPGVLSIDNTDGTPGGDKIDRANARFIAEARHLVPELAAALSRLADAEERAKRADKLARDVISMCDTGVPISAKNVANEIRRALKRP